MGNISHKILLIEDDKLDQMAFEQLVENEKLLYDYIIAGSVSQAQHILGSERFDVVISDYLLGDGTAFDILDLVKNTPFIFVTGAGDTKVAIKAWKAGAYDYLIKDREQNYLKTLPITVENAIRHKKMEEILIRKQGNLEAIFDATPAGMLLLDANMMVRRVNNTIRQLICKEYLHIVNQSIGDALGCVNVASDDKGCGTSSAYRQCPLFKAIRAGLDSEQSVRGVEIHPTLQVGDERITPWFSVSVEPTIIDDSKYVVVALEDITDRKKAEQKLKETMEMKAQFISTVSHELRTPLASMKEGVEIVLDGVVGKINEQQKNFLGIAKRNLDRLARLINEILDFQRFETDKVELNIRDGDINFVVQEVYKTMLSFAKAKGVKLFHKIEYNLPKTRFDSDKIIQVLTNLVSNAIKFTPEHGQVHILVRCQGADLAISVTDTGIGIPREALSKVFDRFYRVHQTDKQIHGTGLGLAIVKKIVMMHNGRIDVESQLNKGSTFTVLLPLAGRAMMEVSAAETESHPQNSPVSS